MDKSWCTGKELLDTISVWWTEFPTGLIYRLFCGTISSTSSPQWPLEPCCNWRNGTWRVFMFLWRMVALAWSAVMITYMWVQTAEAGTCFPRLHIPKRMNSCIRNKNLFEDWTFFLFLLERDLTIVSLAVTPVLWEQITFFENTQINPQEAKTTF